jgi:hypothetical protein
MNKILKKGWALCCALSVLAFNVNAQTFTVATSGLYKVSGNSLVAIPALGTINPGDIVVMPWVSNSTNTSPTGSYSFTANPSGSGTTSYSWSTKGDVGVVSPPNTTLTASIGTVNENNRNTTTDVGQSKGRVYFTWATTPNTCGNQVMYFDIITSVTGTNLNAPGSVVPPAPAIIGPSCLLPNTLYTYSVDPIVSDNLADQIGLDRYWWNVSALTANPYNAVIQYYSTDSSSITIKTAASVPTSATIQCNYGVANTAPWGTGTSYSTKILQAAAAAPAISITSTGISPSPTNLTSYPASVCILTNSTSPYNTSVAFAVTPVTGYTYSWTWSQSTWTSSPVQPVSGSSVTITTDNNPGTVTLTTTGTCGDVRVDVIQVNRKYNSTAMFTVPTCNTDPTFTISTTGGASSAGNLSSTPAFNTPYTGLPTGWTASYTGAGLITVSTGTAVAGNYTLSIGNTCTSPSLSYTATVKPSAPTIAASPSSCGAAGGMVTLTTPTVTGVSYNWAISGGTGYSCPSCIASGGTSVTVTIGTAGTASVTLYETVTGSSPACSSSTTTQTVAISPSAITAVALACTTLNEPSTVNVTATGATGATTYSWSVMPATYGTITASTSTNSSPFAANGTAGTAMYTVTASNAAGCSVTGSGSANIGSAAAFTFSQATYSGYVELTASGAPLGTHYNWVQCSPTTTLATSSNNPSNNPTTSSVWYLATVNMGANLSYSVIGTTSLGCVYMPTCLSVSGYENYLNHGGTSTSGQNYLPDPNFKVFPNPSLGHFSIEMNNASGSGKMLVTDMSGKKITEKSLNSGSNDFDLKLPAGIYMIHMVVNDYSQDEKIVITE